MSDFELENAAMAPRRWIELCGAAAFEKRHLNDFGTTLSPRATRIIDDSLFGIEGLEVDHIYDIFIVPGGRYLVISLYNGLSVLDLGYTSSSDFKLIGSAPEGGCSTCKVQPTPDGMGLIIFSSIV